MERGGGLINPWMYHSFFRAVHVVHRHRCMVRALNIQYLVTYFIIITLFDVRVDKNITVKERAGERSWTMETPAL